MSREVGDDLPVNKNYIGRPGRVEKCSGRRAKEGERMSGGVHL